MRFFMGLLVIFFDLLDNFTTFVCLTADPLKTANAVLVEANPLARWLFEAVGLTQGLIFSTAVTFIAVAFLVFTHRIRRGPRFFLLAVLAILPACASLNNLYVMQQAGIAL